MLPAIVFLKSPESCNSLAIQLTEYLEKLESDNSKTTKTDLKNLDKIEKKMKKLLESAKKKSGKDKLDEDVETEPFTRLSEFNVKYTFLDTNNIMSNEEIDEEINLHRYRKNIPKKLFDAWKRGIGVHHANFHSKFRSSVECLFRKYFNFF